jgi:hypothetical protein
MKKEGGKGSELLYYLHNLWGEIGVGEYIIFGAKGHSFGFGLAAAGSFIFWLMRGEFIHSI